MIIFNKVAIATYYHDNTILVLRWHFNLIITISLIIAQHQLLCLAIHVILKLEVLIRIIQLYQNKTEK